jgi:hypothetical protein
MVTSSIHFRPHHFFCTLAFQGKGYSQTFVDNYQTIKNTLTDDTVIQVINNTDSICSACPHRKDQLCSQETKIQALDNAHARALNLKTGDSVLWGEAKARLKKLSLQDHQQICQGCSWLPLALCAQALINLSRMLLVTSRPLRPSLNKIASKLSHPLSASLQ